MNHDIIFFDRKCPFCCAAANFMARIDKHDRFRFAPLDSKWADFYIPKVKNKSSVVLLERNKGALLRGKGALRIFWLRGGPWKILGALYFLPRCIVDPVYVCIAKVRRYLITEHELNIHPKKML